MPTFNQLVRKGREQATYKSNSPAMQYSLNTLKNKETNLPSPQKRGVCTAVRGPPRCALPHHPRHSGRAGRAGPYAGPFQVRREAPEAEVRSA